MYISSLSGKVAASGTQNKMIQTEIRERMINQIQYPARYMYFTLKTIPYYSPFIKVMHTLSIGVGVAYWAPPVEHPTLGFLINSIIKIN